jgi:hypothetical protein
MGICQDHWDRLRADIEERGLSHLVAPSGVIAAEQMKAQLESGGDSPTSFDPLQAAFWAILTNAGRMLEDWGPGTALYVMTDGDEDPIEDRPGYEGRTWPRCAICYLSLAHEITCTEPRCTLPKVNGYDWMLDKAADGSLERAKELGLVT